MADMLIAMSSLTKRAGSLDDQNWLVITNEILLHFTTKDILLKLITLYSYF